MRNMAKKGLERPYSGLHKVPACTNYRVFQIEVNGEPRGVSVELLKPTYTISPECTWVSHECTKPAYTIARGSLPPVKTYSRKKVVIKA